MSDAHGRDSSRPANPAGSDDTSADAGRRRFFRDFASELMRTAATVAGAANAIQRSSAEAAGAIFNPSSVDEGGPAETANPKPGSPAGFRTAFRLDGDRLILVDQRRLPDRLLELECRTATDVVGAIRDLVVTGAPALGQVAALGLALTADTLRDKSPFMRKAMLRAAANGLAEARPPVANLRWAVDRLMARFEALGGPSGDPPDDGDVVADVLRQEAETIVFEAAADHERLAAFGLEALRVPDGRPLRLLTLGNTGALGCGQFGTALGVVQVAVHRGRQVEVFVSETRPNLEGARIASWELTQAGVPHTLIADSAAGSLLAAGGVDAVLVGAERVAANGDTASTIGAYPLAVLAGRHAVPFYVCAPLSSVDPATRDASGIALEQRPAPELTRFRGVSIAPNDVVALNPGIDVTPAALITGIVTEEGTAGAPYGPALAAAADRGRARKAHPAAHARFVPDTAVATSR